MRIVLGRIVKTVFAFALGIVCAPLFPFFFAIDAWNESIRFEREGGDR